MTESHCSLEWNDWGPLALEMNVWGSLEGGVTHSHDTSASVSIATVTAEQYFAKMGVFSLSYI